MKSLLTLLAVLNTAASSCYNGQGHANDSVCRRGRHWPCDSQVAFPESCAATAWPSQSRHSQRSSLTKHEYVDAVVRFLEEKYWRCERPLSRKEVKKALGIVYEMLHQNFVGLVVFTSHVVFGTGGLLRLQAGTGRWTSRGILQITGKENYEKLCQITGSDYFCRYPRALATLREDAVRASVCFWLRLVEEHFGCYEKAKISFWETLRLLCPSEARHPEWPESRARIQNRKADYDALLAALERRC